MTDGCQTVAEFLEGLAGETTPAGGSAAAVAGATGAALCEMVCTGSLADGDGPTTDRALTGAREELRDRRAELLALADDDAAAVEALFLGDDPTEADRERALAVPVSVAEACQAVLEAATVAADRAGGELAVDAATGAVLARAGLRAAGVTARANLDRVADADVADGAEERLAAAEADGEEALQAVLAGVEDGA